MAGNTAPGTDRLLPMVGHAVNRAVAAIDDAVPAEKSRANTVLEDKSRRMPWIGVAIAVCAALTVPWVVYIAVTLPAREESSNYDVAWAGFDVFLIAALAFTAYAVLRRSPWVGMSAGGAAALLVTDAWFDLLTAPTTGSILRALGMGFLVELPLALVCVWLCRHAKNLADRRLAILLQQSRAGTDDAP